MSVLDAVVLAAGRGKRMKSELPKVLHPIAGRPLLYFPVRAALDLGARRVVVVVSPDTREAVRVALARHLPHAPLEYAVQDSARGTGDAAKAGLSLLSDPDRVLFLYGDTPLVEAADLRPLLEPIEAGMALAFLTFDAPNPAGYGRVIRDGAGKPRAIVEQRDLDSDAERSITEVNAGIYVGELELLRSALSTLKPQNAQGEYYLTDIVAEIARRHPVGTASADMASLAGVNDRQQLAEAETRLHARIRERLARGGVSIVGDPLIDDGVLVEADARIEAGVRLRGSTCVGAGSLIDVGSVLEDAQVGRQVTIKPYSVITQSRVGDGAVLGPFCHLRPGSDIGDSAHVGNFVETKNAQLGPGAKANHLAYLGDVDVGARSNVGAGTIVCNYDGFAKRRTTVGADVFIGSDTQLVAPVTVGHGAYVGTGTTVTVDVPAGALAIGRVRQENRLDYLARAFACPRGGSQEKGLKSDAQALGPELPIWPNRKAVVTSGLGARAHEETRQVDAEMRRIFERHVGHGRGRRRTRRTGNATERRVVHVRRARQHEAHAQGGKRATAQESLGARFIGDEYECAPAVTVDPSAGVGQRHGDGVLSGSNGCRRRAIFGRDRQEPCRRVVHAGLELHR
jgi:bifunctional UDP-N-acetylglucosamine pyrophosphorylase / glucosamine-1-phosphate N-acetyltransferase